MKITSGLSGLFTNLAFICRRNETVVSDWMYLMSGFGGGELQCVAKKNVRGLWDVQSRTMSSVPVLGSYLSGLAGSKMIGTDLKPAQVVALFRSKVNDLKEGTLENPGDALPCEIGVLILKRDPLNDPRYYKKHPDFTPDTPSGLGPNVVAFRAPRPRRA